jgi:hypothetical protein
MTQIHDLTARRAEESLEDLFKLLEDDPARAYSMLADLALSGEPYPTSVSMVFLLGMLTALGSVLSGNSARESIKNLRKCHAEKKDLVLKPADYLGKRRKYGRY